MSPVVYDKLIAGTPFRGLILRSMTHFCAYIGVPEDSWLADMEHLDFQCHRGVNFRRPGDGVHRPKGFFWYGWDYGHAGDEMTFPPEVMDVMPAEFADLLPKGKKWTVEEIEQDIFDAAMDLTESMKSAEELASRLGIGSTPQN